MVKSYKTYIGRRTLGCTTEGGFHVFIEKDGVQKPLDPVHSQNIINHSPDGFNWGYYGSGPAQLSLGILFDVTNDKNLSLRYYHDFKVECVGGLPIPGWKIKEEEVIKWLDKKSYDSFKNLIENLSEEHSKSKYKSIGSEKTSEIILSNNWNKNNIIFEEILHHLEIAITRKRKEVNKNEKG